MKNLVFIGILLMFTTPAFSELSDSDIQRIREIVQLAVAAEGKQIRTEITAAIKASEKRMIEYQDIKSTSLDKRIDLLASLLVGIMALIVLAVGAPQLILAYRQRKHEQQLTSIQEFRAAYEDVLVQLKELKAENEAIRQRISAQSEHRSS